MLPLATPSQRKFYAEENISVVPMSAVLKRRFWSSWQFIDWTSPSPASWKATERFLSGCPQKPHEKSSVSAVHHIDKQMWDGEEHREGPQTPASPTSKGVRGRTALDELEALGAPSPAKKQSVSVSSGDFET